MEIFARLAKWFRIHTKRFEFKIDIEAIHALKYTQGKGYTLRSSVICWLGIHAEKEEWCWCIPDADELGLDHHITSTNSLVQFKFKRQDTAVAFKQQFGGRMEAYGDSTLRSSNR